MRISGVRRRAVSVVRQPVPTFVDSAWRSTYGIPTAAQKSGTAFAAATSSPRVKGRSTTSTSGIVARKSSTKPA